MSSVSGPLGYDKKGGLEVSERLMLAMVIVVVD